MIPFYGWSMPLHYGSQIREHEQVRQSFGMFDVSHMTIIDVLGDERLAFLSYLLANDVGKLRVLGQAQYTLMLDERAGILDDLIVYYMSDRFRLIVNSSTRQKILDWLALQAKAYPQVKLQERDDLAMIAIQGPEAREFLSARLGKEARSIIMELLPFTSDAQENWQIARTGYTGEDGVEIILPAAEAVALWDDLIQAGMNPCGLGARDTLRLEAGLNLYGQDMDETVSPLASGLGWVLSMEDDRDFIGRTALESEKAQGSGKRLIGLLLQAKGILRAGYELSQSDGQVVGALTSGSFSPTLSQSIGLARMETQWLPNEPLFVSIRGQRLPVLAVRPPFYRSGKRLHRPFVQAEKAPV